METDDQPSGEPSAPPAAAYPSWILLEDYGGCEDQRLISDASTVAHARTSKGRPISLSLGLAAPPAVSGLHLHGHDLPEGVNIRPRVIAAHGDSLLVNIQTRKHGWNNDDVFAYDYFIYCAGDAAVEPSRPPSLSLLPPLYHDRQEEGAPKEKRSLDEGATALLRRDQEEVLVAELRSCRVMNQEESLWPVAARLGVLRSGSDREWGLKWLPVIHDEGKRKEISFWWTDAVIPVADRFLLWADYFRGIIYMDVWHETLCYVSLPVEPVTRRSLERCGSYNRSVCATNGGREVRFLEVFPHSCCTCPGATTRTRRACGNAFTITTWALRMDDMMTWEKVGVINCNELWSMPTYHGAVPKIKPQYPTVSLDDPDVLCFMVQKTTYDMPVKCDLNWLIELRH